MKDRTWNVMIILIGGSLAVFLFFFFPNIDANFVKNNPYTSSLITCKGKEMPFYSENSSMAGVVKCDNGTLIKVHYLQSINGTFTYSGFRFTP